MIGVWLKRRWSSRLDEFPFPIRAEAEALLTRLRSGNLTYVGLAKLRNLAWSAITVRERGIAGDFIEAGVALGGSAILLATLKPHATPLLLYDVFATIPPPGAEDGEDAHARYAEIAEGKASGLGEGQYYGYVEDLLGVVRSNLARFGLAESEHRITLIKGLFEETLHPPGPIALAHIDCDWYDSVRISIARIYPVLSPGGIMVFDDYRSYSGCRKAVDEF